MLKGKKAVAFAGLADNDQFFDSLEQAGCVLVQHVFLCRPPPVWLQTIWTGSPRRLKKTRRDVLVTTFKDYVKIENRKRWPLPLVSVDVEIQLLDHAHRFRNFLSHTP